jgi:hypothetical protein
MTYTDSYKNFSTLFVCNLSNGFAKKQIKLHGAEKEAVMAQFKVKSRNVSGLTECTQQQFLSERPGAQVEPQTSEIQVGNITA